MALHVRSWEKWQGAALYDRLRKRKPTGRAAPIQLTFIALATDLDDSTGNFAAFAEAVGGGVKARGYWLTLLGYIGRNAATTGAIRISARQFGPVVLTDRMDTVSVGTGAKVYRALINSGLCEEIPDGDITEVGQVTRMAREPSREDGREPSPVSGGNPAALEREREEEREKDPPSPQRGASDPVPGSAGNGRAIRPRDRERWLRTLDFVVVAGVNAAHPPGRSRELARKRRAEARAGSVNDHEIMRQLQQDYAWVTPERLARNRDNRP